MKKHGLKILTTSLSLALFFGTLSGFGMKAQAAEETLVLKGDSSFVQPAVLKLDRQVGLTIQQKKAEEVLAEAARLAEAQRVEAERLAKEAAEKAAAAAKAKTSIKKSVRASKYSYKPSVPYNASIGEKVVAAAMTRLGIPYGAVIDGVTYDCSGLTQWCYKQAGISISRSSYTQANDCREIPKSQIQAGDLVFWQTNGKINHVGVYAGGGMVIDASPHGVVKRAIYETSSQKIAFYGRPY